MIATIISVEAYTFLDTVNILGSLLPCHVKVHTWKTAPSSHPTNTFLSHLTLANSGSISILSFHKNYSITKLETSGDVDSYTDYSKPSKFAQCFIHSYLQDDLLFPYYPYWGLYTHILASTMSEWPNHLLFVINKSPDLYTPVEIENRITFYTSRLPSMYTRGYILQTSQMSNMSLICILCSFDDDDVKPIESLPSKTFLRQMISSGVSGNFFQMNGHMARIMAEDGDLYDCDVTPKFRPRNVPHEWNLCVYKFLREKFNVSFDPDNSQTLRFVNAGESNGYINAFNFYVLKLYGNKEWIPYDVQFSPYYFMVLRWGPYVDTNSFSAFSRPFQWEVWILVSISLITMITISILIAWRNSIVQVSTILLTAASSILDQSPDQIFVRIHDSSKHIPGSKALHICWVIWIWMVIVGVNGYKGMIFAFLTQEMKPIWPGSLTEMLRSTDIAVAAEIVYDFKLKTHAMLIRRTLLDSIMKGISGIDFPEEFTKLNDSLLYINYSGTYSNIFEMETVKRNLQRGKSDKRKFHFFNRSTTSFALVNTNPAPIAQYIKDYLPDVISSLPVPIPGYTHIRPWSLEKNYFHEYFLEFLGMLEAT